MKAVGAVDFASSRRFEILARLGSGAMGDVYEARDVVRDARVALKTVRTPSPAGLRILKQEFRSVQGLQHPNLVKLGELFEEDGRWFFTMEFVRGEPFLDYVCRDAAASLTSGRRFDETRLRATLPQLVQGLCALHAAQKVHRDIKPANVLVTSDGRVVIVDFGLLFDARALGHHDEGGMVGTPAYMAPEQAMGDELVGPPADWYAMGCVLYQALTGSPPFGGDFTELLEKKISLAPPMPSEVAPNIPHDLDALCAELLSIDPSSRPDGREIANRLRGGSALAKSNSAPPKSGVFVGRRTELAALREAHDAAAAGAAVAVFVHGESGVGKSALIRHFTSRVLAHDPDGVVVLRGRCHERESVPFKGLDGVVDDLCRFLHTLDPASAAALLPDDFDLLCRAFPALADAAVSAAVASEVDIDRIANPNERRARLYGAVRELVARIGRRWQLIVAVDDLQWTDTDSLALLLEILRGPSAPRLLFVATMRLAAGDGEATQTVVDHIRRIQGDVRHVDVQKLPSEDAERLTTLLLGDDALGVTSDDARDIACEARGHPLFIDELVRQRAMQGTAVGLVRLDDAIWERVEAIEAAPRRLLEVVVMAGRPLGLEKAGHAASLEPAALFSAATALHDAHLIAAMGVHAADTLEPYHDRVRESVLAHFDADTRRALHARLALAEEKATSPDFEALAAHWEGADNPGRASEYAVLAGDRASRALAFDRAVDWYRRALTLGAPDVAAVRSNLAEALTDGGRDAEAADARLEMAAEAPVLDALDLRRRAAEQLLLSGHFERGYTLLRAVLLAVGERFPKSPLAVVFWVLVVRLALRVRGLDFREPRAGRLGKKLLVRIDSTWSAGAGFAMTDNIRGAYFQTKNLLLALSAGDTRRIARALALEVCFTSAGGSTKRTRTLSLLRVAKDLAARVGTPDARALGDTAAGYASYMVGEWAAAKAALIAAEARFRDECIGVNWELNSTRTMLFRTLVLRGDFNELGRRVPPVLREAKQRGDRFCELNVRSIPVTMLMLAADEATEARRELDEVSASLPTGVFLVQHFYTLIARGQVDLYEGDPTTALKRLRAAWPIVKRSLLLRVESLRISALEQRGRAAVATALRMPASESEMIKIAQADATALEGLGVAWAAAFALVLRAGVEAIRGDRAAVLTRLTLASSRFAAADMALHSAAVRLRLGQVTGGDEGSALVREATAHMKSEGVMSPEKMASLFVPAVERIARPERVPAP